MKKTLIPYYGKIPTSDHDRVAGGMEKFLFLVQKSFPDFVVPLQLQMHDHERDAISDAIRRENIELILDNYCASWAREDFGIPSKMVMHLMPTEFSVKEFRENYSGQETFFVSLTQLKKWLVVLKGSPRVRASAFTIFPSYVENKFEPRELKYDLITVGRANPHNKNPFLCHELALKHGLKSLVITNNISFSQKDTSIFKGVLDYEEENKKKWIQDDHKTVWNIPNEEIYPYLNESKVFMSTYGYEASGISILEAASCGVPVMFLHCEYLKHHAGMEFFYGARDQYTEFTEETFIREFEHLSERNNRSFLANRVSTLFNKEEFDKRINVLLS